MALEAQGYLNFDLTPRQSDAFRILTSWENADLLYGGAKGGGKSFLLCVWALWWAQYLVDFFELQPSRFPVPLGFIGRKRSVDFNDTTMETWKRFIPAELYEIRSGDKEIIICEGAGKILYGGLDNQETINKFNSAELAYYAIDQAEETDEDDLAALAGSLRLVIKGRKPPYKKLHTANPRAGHLKNKYIKRRQKGTSFVKALYRDNPYLPDDYATTLEAAFGHNPALLAANRDGEWDVFEGMFFEEFQRRYHTYTPGSIAILPTWPRFISVDWGYGSPMAVYWHAVGPDRHVFTYREWYKTRVLDEHAAREILEITQKAGETIEYAVGDPQSFAVEIAHHKFGRTVSMKRSEVWAGEGLPLLMGDSKRVPGWSRMRSYLGLADGPEGKESHWHISTDCTNLLDEITTAVHDKNKIEDISADSVDHALESCRLFLMSRPPLVTASKDRPMSMLEAAERQAERDRRAQGKPMGMQ